MLTLMVVTLRYFGTNNGYGRNGVQVYNYPMLISPGKRRAAKLRLRTYLFKNLNITAEVYKYHRTNILQTTFGNPYNNGSGINVSANFGTADQRVSICRWIIKQSLGGKRDLYRQGVT
jgi:hypothetical protein